MSIIISTVVECAFLIVEAYSWKDGKTDRTRLEASGPVGGQEVWLKGVKGLALTRKEEWGVEANGWTLHS